MAQAPKQSKIQIQDLPQLIKLDEQQQKQITGGYHGTPMTYNFQNVEIQPYQTTPSSGPSTTETVTFHVHRFTV
jgi:hypothetical protein